MNRLIHRLHDNMRIHEPMFDSIDSNWFVQILSLLWMIITYILAFLLWATAGCIMLLLYAVVVMVMIPFVALGDLAEWIRLKYRASKYT